jgi:phospholipid/cholesterol/gamma-HCH transport system substrate-binding protein
VSSVDLEGKRAVIELAIDDAHAPLPRDTRFAVRLRTLIGETFVDLYPGRSGSGLADGAVLPMSSQAREYVDVEQILDVLKGDTRRRARRMIQGLGGGLDDRGPQLNDLLARLSGVVDRGAPVTKVLHSDRAQIARLVDQFGDVTRSLADRGDAIRGLARQGRTTFRAVAARDRALRATLDELPPALAQIRRTSTTLGTETGRAAPVLADLGVVVRRLRPAVDLLEPSARRGRSVLRELGAAAPVLSRTLDRAEALAGPTAEAMPALGRTLCQFNPMIGYLAPYAQEAAATLQNMASATNYYDASGHAARVQALVGTNNFAGYSPAQSDAVKTLLDSGLVGRIHTSGYNPYPKPGDVGPPSEGVGQTGPRDYKGTYRRVEADC